MNDKYFPVNPFYCIPESDITSINEKIEQLFKVRIESYIPKANVGIKQKLLEIQKIVYIIDHYGEHQDIIDPVVLSSMFEQIQSSIARLGLQVDHCARLIQDLKDYATMETEVKNGKNILDFDLEYFYLKKSCDTRLQRHLVRFLNDQEVASTRNEVIRDILEEIIDDIDDIEEDKQGIFNGNRLLDILRSNAMNKLDEYTSLAQTHMNTHPDEANKIINEIKKMQMDNILHLSKITEMEASRLPIHPGT